MYTTTKSAKSWHFRLARNLAHIPVEWEPDPQTPEEVAQLEETGDSFGIAKKPVYRGNLCHYIPYVIEGLFKYICMLVLCTAFFYPIMVFIMYLAACVSTGSIIEIDGTAELGLNMVTVISIGFLTVYAYIKFLSWHYDWSSMRRAKKREQMIEDAEKTPPKPKEPGFLVLCYRKFKDKTCIGLTIK
jgi:hypothetical protein